MQGIATAVLRRTVDTDLKVTPICTCCATPPTPVSAEASAPCPLESSAIGLSMYMQYFTCGSVLHSTVQPTCTSWVYALCACGACTILPVGHEEAIVNQLVTA